jgi:hypothetical protein
MYKNEQENSGTQSMSDWGRKENERVETCGETLDVRGRK